jgi:hypothetical protein
MSSPYFSGAALVSPLYGAIRWNPPELLSLASPFNSVHVQLFLQMF